jgi:hypothetical protein
MALAALIISITAALFAGWQALAQHQAFRIERDRRHDERIPVFETRTESFPVGMRVLVTLTSPWQLDKVELTSPGSTGDSGISGAYPPR